MKSYYNFDKLFEKEGQTLRTYVHKLMLEKPKDNSYKECFYLSKPSIYVVVYYETNENDMFNILREQSNGRQ